MSDTAETADAPAAEAAAPEMEAHSLTAEQATALLAGKSAPPQEEARQQEQEEPTAELEPTAEETEETPAQEEEESETPSILEHAFPDGLSEEQRAQLAQELGGRAGKDIGRLRQENRALKEALQQESSKGKDPFETQPQDNPFAGKSSMEELQEIYQSAAEVSKAGTRALRRHASAKPEDAILELDGKSYTRAQVEDMVDAADDAKDTFLPARAQELQKEQAGIQAREANKEKAYEAHSDWLNDTAKEQFEAVLEQAVGMIKRGEVPSDLPQILLNSVAYAQGQAPATSAAAPAAKKSAPALKPPSAPARAAAPSNKPLTRDRAKAKAFEQFNGSGSAHDLQELLAMRMQP